MADQSYTSLEEQFRQDRMLGRAKRRRRCLKVILPSVLILCILFGVRFLLREPPQEASPVEESALPAPGTASATISFVGDINLDRSMMDAFLVGTDYDFSPLFRRITTRLSAADLTVGNFEGFLSEADKTADHAYPPALLQALYGAGFDILQTANSYSIQNGIGGLNATKQGILAAGFDALGTWTSAEDRAENGVLIREVNGIRFAFLAFTKGLNNLRLPQGAEYCVNLLYKDYDTNYTELDKASIQAAVEQARSCSPDVIIAMVHWGSEYEQTVAKSQKDAAKLLFESGVHVIIGSHSHFVGPMELTDRELSPGSGGNFIAYSLGDFISVADNSAAHSGCVLSLDFRKNGNDVTIHQVQYTPTYSASPSEELGIKGYELLDTPDAIRFYEDGYYDRVSEKLYGLLVSEVQKMQEQTGLGASQAKNKG